MGSEKIFSRVANQNFYPFKLPDLPFPKNSFSNYMSEKTFDFHHGKHHAAYVNNLNKLLEDKSEMHKKTLEEIILASYGKSEMMGVFNNSAQVWNHSFFWHCLSPNGGGEPKGDLMAQVKKDFGSYDSLKEKFAQAAATQFGSGWAWLVADSTTKKLEIVKTGNAELPITQNLIPILTLDVWEHAYYLDYQNKRPDYISIFLNNLVNWDFAEKNFAAI